MTDKLHEQLADYARAVGLANETYPRMSSDERTVRMVAGMHLADHAPSNHTDPTCTGCDGEPWPCAIAENAIKYVDPRYN
ncbi:hypothetical protein [Streptomyces sp. NPDC004589]|uniref:hypothetical protein n=1 Tax=Streptomyces sp. NPDC004589 TaxID=3154553 RepID=UPI0033AF93DF